MNDLEQRDDSMKISTEIPTKAQIINGGFELHVAPKGTKWMKSQLGDYSDKRGCLYPAQ
jgi:hypothetical protein